MQELATATGSSLFTKSVHKIVSSLFLCTALQVSDTVPGASLLLVSLLFCPLHS